ncbi:MAG: tetratricopeptide repeat protein [Pyrinomonadaceae bacterium]
MATNLLKNVILPAAIIIAGLAAVPFLSGYVEHCRPPLPEGYADSDLSVNGSNLRGYVFGMEGLLADWYFMRSLQYVGDKVLGSKNETINIDNLRDLNPRLLYPLLENATDLDPHFVAAYSYGAVVLPAIDPEKAIDLALKGIAANPDNWRLYQHLAYIYWRLGRFDKAAEFYEKGAAVTGSSPFMKMMSASMKTEGGSRGTARSIYREMFQSSDDDQVRITAQRRLNEIDSLDERDAIDGVLAAFRQNTGRCANSLSEILPLLRSVKLPEGRDFRVDKANNLIDPTDAPYLLDKETCKVKLDGAQTGLPLK